MIHILIYLLDDNLSDLETMTRVLSRTDTFSIKTFYDPDAFKAALSEDVYMVITDIGIMDYNVFETASAIKRDYPGIYMVVVSGYFDNKIFTRLINECHVWGIVDKNEQGWTDNLKSIVDLTVPKMLDKKMALSND
jgi:DNA-binding NarL/FixJ family response regulator